jgi:multidrug transporter EmrE-like cation transporter
MRTFSLIVTSILLGAFGQLSMKKGMAELGAMSVGLSTLTGNIVKILSSPFVLLGLFLYVVSTFFWLAVLSRVELSYAYPMISVGYVVVFILSWLLLQERLPLIRIIGLALICIGVLVVSRS